MNFFVDGMGWLASGLVMATFCMHDMVALRGLAIASNLAFIAYGALAGLGPILVLHLMLLPLNLVRLAQAKAKQRRAPLRRRVAQGTASPLRKAKQSAHAHRSTSPLHRRHRRPGLAAPSMAAGPAADGGHA